jgi:hypothetical protein
LENFIQAYGASSTGSIRSFVRKSVDGGASWTMVDDSGIGAGSSDAQFDSVVTDTGNGVYQIGIVTVTPATKRTSASSGWLVRRSSDGEATFTTMDDFQYVAGVNTYYGKLVADSQGRVTVVGHGLEAPSPTPSATGLNCWIVRQSSDGVAPFTTIDTFREQAPVTILPRE